MINKDSIAKMKHGVVIINCSRGGLVRTEDLIKGLDEGKIYGAGLDVYENEKEYFFSD
jgi:D-lactate dehydrogenase